MMWCSVLGLYLVRSKVPRRTRFTHTASVSRMSREAIIGGCTNGIKRSSTLNQVHSKLQNCAILSAFNQEKISKTMETRSKVQLRTRGFICHHTSHDKQKCPRKLRERTFVMSLSPKVAHTTFTFASESGRPTF